MSIKIRLCNNINECNQFLQTMAPESIKEIKPIINNNNNKFMITYESDQQFKYKHVNDAQSQEVIDLLANHADNAWNQIDEAAGEGSLELAINLLCNTTLSMYFPDSHPLSKARSSLVSPDLTTNFNHRFFTYIKDAQAYRVYQLMLNTSRYDRGQYGYVLATYYPNDPNYQTKITYLYFLDNNFNIHGNYFALDAEHVTQWRLDDVDA